MLGHLPSFSAQMAAERHARFAAEAASARHARLGRQPHAAPRCAALAASLPEAILDVRPAGAVDAEPAVTR